MSEPAAPPRTKRKGLPFKRTVARKKTPDPFTDELGPIDAPKEADRSQDLLFFSRSKDSFQFPEDVVEPEPKRAVKREDAPATPLKKEPVKLERKRTNVSLGTDSDIDSGFAESGSSRKRRATPSSSKKTVSSPVEVDDGSDDDFIMDVKGKGKEIVTPRSLRSGRASINVTPSQPTNSFNADEEDIAALRAQIARKQTDSPSHGGPSRGWQGFLEEEEDALRLGDPPVDSHATKISVSEDEEPEIAEIEPPDEFAQYIEQARAKAELAAAQHDEVAQKKITIMIDSRIPNTVALCLRRRMGQSLDLCFRTWTQWQASKGSPLPDDLVDKLFMTWKGNKIYGSASASTLPGVELDSDGNLKDNTFAGPEGGFYEGGLYIEVWSDELLAEHERARQRERQLSLGIMDEVESLPEIESQTEPGEADKAIRVILKAKELDPVKLTVHMYTTVGTMINAFRKQRGIGLESAVTLYFDGDVLEEESKVEELDIDPDDTNQLEVHVK